MVGVQRDTGESNRNMDLAAEVARVLLQIKAIKLSPQTPFTWASGIQSPIYCDNRVVLSHPDQRNFIKQGLIEKSHEFKPFDAVAGVATAGIPHGALLADALGLPFAYIRSSAKSHGRQNRIEGDLKGNERVLVVEDLISTGGSSLEAVEAIRSFGCTVQGVLAIFTYGFPNAEKAFADAQCEFRTLSDYDHLIEAAIETQYISETDRTQLTEWRQSFGTT
jgi:orotate phosphoribosyltransferase